MREEKGKKISKWIGSPKCPGAVACFCPLVCVNPVCSVHVSFWVPEFKPTSRSSTSLSSESESQCPSRAADSGDCFQAKVQVDSSVLSSILHAYNESDLPHPARLRLCLCDRQVTFSELLGGCTHLQNRGSHDGQELHAIHLWEQGKKTL